MEIKRIAYERYKLRWLIDHGYSISQLIEKLAEIENESDYCEDANEAYKEFEAESGFGGELWVCFDEFTENEFQDRAYIRTLLNDREYIEYLECIILCK